jgi:hypothetical protein
MMGQGRERATTTCDNVFSVNKTSHGNVNEKMPVCKNDSFL